MALKAPLVKCLPWEHKDLSLISSSYEVLMKSPAWWLVLVISVREMETDRIPVAHCLVSLTCLVSSRLVVMALSFLR